MICIILAIIGFILTIIWTKLWLADTSEDMTLTDYVDDITLTDILGISGIILLIVSIIGIYIYGIHYNTGGGKHIGYISSIETTGIIYKTPRAYFKTSLRSSQEDEYCIENMKLYDKLNALQSENITITYKSYLVNGVKNCSGEAAIITNFEATKN
jgi:hypothetical protein